MKKYKRVDLRKFMGELCNDTNWSPNYSKISQKLGISVSTVFDKAKKLQSEGRISVKVRELTYAEISEGENERKN